MYKRLRATTYCVLIAFAFFCGLVFGQDVPKVAPIPPDGHGHPVEFTAVEWLKLLGALLVHTSVVLSVLWRISIKLEQRLTRLETTQEHIVEDVKEVKEVVVVRGVR